MTGKEKIDLLNRTQKLVDVGMEHAPSNSIMNEKPCYVIDCLLANYETALMNACHDQRTLEKLLRPLLVVQSIARKNREK